MKPILALLASLLLTACATKAYRAVEHECALSAYKDYPVSLMRTLQTRQRMVQVPTGMRSCVTDREGAHRHTICTDITRPEVFHYQEIVDIDQHEIVRNMAIASCAQNLCLQRYGNAQCKTDVLLAPVK